MPSNSPEMPRSESLYSCEVRYWLYGSSSEAIIPLIAPSTRTLRSTGAAGVAVGDGVIGVPERLERLGLRGGGAGRGGRRAADRIARQEQARAGEHRDHRQRDRERHPEPSATSFLADDLQPVGVDAADRRHGCHRAGWIEWVRGGVALAMHLARHGVVARIRTVGAPCRPMLRAPRATGREHEWNFMGPSWRLSEGGRCGRRPTSPGSRAPARRPGRGSPCRGTATRAGRAGPRRSRP